MRANMLSMLAGAAMMAGEVALPRKHRQASSGKRMAPRRRQRAAQGADHAARSRRFVRSQNRLEELRKQVKRGELTPVHPRDHHWFIVGLLGMPFTLDAPIHGGGSYHARYRAMYEAGVAHAEQAKG